MFGWRRRAAGSSGERVGGPDPDPRPGPEAPPRPEATPRPEPTPRPGAADRYARHLPVHLAAAHQVAWKHPDAWSVERVLDALDERCPACLGTHALADVDREDLIYLVLGHGLDFPRPDELAWAGERDGRC